MNIYPTRILRGGRAACKYKARLLYFMFSRTSFVSKKRNRRNHNPRVSNSIYLSQSLKISCFPPYYFDSSFHCSLPLLLIRRMIDRDMDFEPVFRCLTELFPQVDSRMLKAVAIEHSNDVDAAAEFILSEVLSSLSGPSDASHSAHDSQDVSCKVKLKEHNISSLGTEEVQRESVTCGTSNSGDSVRFTPPFSGETEETTIDVETNNHYSTLSILEGSPRLVGNGSPVNDINISASEYEYDELLSRCLAACAGRESVTLESVRDTSSSVNENSMDSVECRADVPVDSNGALGEGEDQSTFSAHCELLACDTQVDSLEEDNRPMILSTRPGHIVNLDLLEDFVADAKANKKTLVSAVESVVNMMKEAELLEERAKQTKQEASSAGQDILAKVDELKQMLQHVKQANDMHAGEVYGEIAILSTEARELQSRLLNMSEERNKSFSIIEEIRETLQARLAAAKDEIAEAEKEKHEKEDVGRKALKEQEAFMDAIVQESRKLQQEAEENAKLREFLADRGRIVDTLQGEIAVICEDVMLLKKRVDEQAPLKGSPLMTTYSSSSSSSLGHKSTSSIDGLLPDEQLGENNRESSEEDHVESKGQEYIVTISGNEKDKDRDKHKPTLDDDDGWELLKNDACPF